MPKQPQQTQVKHPVAGDKSKATPFRAFTVKASGPMPALRLHVQLSIPVTDPQGLPDDQLSLYTGFINTCQPATQISRRVVETLNVPKTLLRGQEVYIVDIYLPNRIRFAGVPAHLIDDPEKDCVVGMDILTCGDLAITHAEGKTCFSFRVPSVGVIDFVEEHKGFVRNMTEHTDLKKPGSTTMVDRNQLCPCGSGKKHKNCCGKYH